MLDFTIDKSTLSQTTTILQAFVDEAVLEFTPTDVESTVMDPSNVGLVSVIIPSEVFLKYTADTNTKLGINLDKLDNFLSVSGSDTVSVTLNEDTRKLEFESDGLEYTMALIDPESIRTADMPSVDYTGYYTIPSGEFSQALKATDMVADTVTFESEDGTLYFRANGDTDNVDYEFNEETVSVTDSPEDGSSIFSMMYMNEIKKAVPTTELEAFVADEQPTRMHFTFADEDTESNDSDGSQAEATFFVAPRIQS